MSTCEWWVPVVTSAVPSVILALLLLILYFMLSRKIAQHSCGMQASSSPGEHPSPHPTLTPATSLGGDKAQPPGAQPPGAQHHGAQHPGAQQPGAQKPAPSYAGSSDTSSDTSEDSADSPACPQARGGSEGNLNYASVAFLGKGGEPDPARDYENVKAGVDYVNVDPEKKKTRFWPFSSPRASKAVEYTEVKL